MERKNIQQTEEKSTGTLAGTGHTEGRMAGLRRGRQKVVRGGPDTSAGAAHRQYGKGQVSQVLRSLAHLADVLTPSSRQEQVSPSTVVRNLVSEGLCPATRYSVDGASRE